MALKYFKHDVYIYIYIRERERDYYDQMASSCTPLSNRFLATSAPTPCIPIIKTLLLLNLLNHKYVYHTEGYHRVITGVSIRVIRVIRVTIA